MQFACKSYLTKMSPSSSSSSNNRRLSRRRNANNGRTRTTIYRNPIPPSNVCTMSYCSNFSLTATTGAYTAKVFRLNSTLDPDQTGTGHQPFGRDQLAALYSEYRVFRADWTLHSNPGSSAYPGTLAVTACTTLNSLLDTEAMVEMPYSKSLANAVSGNPNPPLSDSVSLYNLSGQSRAEYIGDDENRADYNANAVAVYALHVGLDNNAAVTTAAYCSLRITYYVEWFHPFTLGGS